MSMLLNKKQTGFTLIELMVAMVISLMLMAGTISIFISNKQVYRVSEASSRVQESARFALNFLKRDIRMAGFMGCLGIASGVKANNNVDTTKVPSANLSYAVNGFDGTNSVIGYSYATGTLPAGMTSLGLSTGTSAGNVMPNTDSVVIKRAEACDGGNIVNPKDNANFKIADNTSCGIKKNDVVMVTNCEQSDLFAVVNTVQPTASPATLSTGSSLNINNKVSGSYGQESEIYKFQVAAFYIGVGSRNGGGPSLYSRTLVNGAFVNRELVEDVEDMVITYGVDTDSDKTPNYYVAAGSLVAADWDKVISVRITVDVRSPQQNIVQSTAIADRRLRHTFTETIQIRNRI